MKKGKRTFQSAFHVKGDPEKKNLDCLAPYFFAMSTVASKLVRSHLLKGFILIVHECVVTQHN